MSIIKSKKQLIKKLLKGYTYKTTLGNTLFMDYSKINPFRFGDSILNMAWGNLGCIIEEVPPEAKKEEYVLCLLSDQLMPTADIPYDSSYAMTYVKKRADGYYESLTGLPWRYATPVTPEMLTIKR